MQNYKYFLEIVLSHRWNSSRSSFPSPLSSNLFIILLTWARHYLPERRWEIISLPVLTPGSESSPCSSSGIPSLLWTRLYLCREPAKVEISQLIVNLHAGRPMQRKKQKHETAFVAIAQFQAVKRNGGWFVEFFKQEMKIIRHCPIGNKWYNLIWFADFFFDQMAFLEFWFVFIQLLRASIVSNDDFV